ncbi:MAG: DUF1127 domain-containing protein [Alphaproteobacteria bacterium]|nr:MAG: DUF1127 domain-containing protein [Alphaproteobacteria bacterium]
MAFAQDTRVAHHSLADRAGALFRAAAEAYRRHRLYRQTLNELASLSDRELNDLGLSRAMIRGIAYEAAYGAKG